MEKELVATSHLRNCSVPYGDLNLENIFQGPYSVKSDYNRLGAVVEGSLPIWYIQNNTLTPRTPFRPPLMYHGNDHVNVIRRKPVAKDNTGALKLWLLQHKKNPYPNKPEKIMLAILSRMTLTQVSTWFANARRRLKKEFPEDDFDILTDSLQQNNCYSDH